MSPHSKDYPRCIGQVQQGVAHISQPHRPVVCKHQTSISSKECTQLWIVLVYYVKTVLNFPHRTNEPSRSVYYLLSVLFLCCEVSWRMYSYICGALILLPHALYSRHFHKAQLSELHQTPVKRCLFLLLWSFWSSFWRFIQEKLPQRLDNSLAKRADFRGFGLTVILPPITGGFWPIRILQASAASTICCGLMYQCALNAKSARPHVMRPQFLLTKQLMSACKIKFKCTCLKSVFLDKSEV